jgi:hypothetical protein
MLRWLQHPRLSPASKNSPQLVPIGTGDPIVFRSRAVHHAIIINRTHNLRITSSGQRRLSTSTLSNHPAASPSTNHPVLLSHRVPSIYCTSSLKHVHPCQNESLRVEVLNDGVLSVMPYPHPRRANRVRHSPRKVIITTCRTPTVLFASQLSTTSLSILPP